MHFLPTTSSSAILSSVAGLVLGGAFGAMAQRTHFCTMGALSDAVLFGSLRRLRVWALAAGLALLVTQGLAAAGLLGLDAATYRAPRLPWLGALSGGVAFGFGMVLAGGCASRALVRLGSGSLKALLVVLVMAVVAATLTTGLLAGAPLLMDGVASIPLPRAAPGLDGLLRPLVPGWLTAALVGGGLVVFALRERACRRPTADLLMALVLAAAVVTGWLVTAGIDPTRPQSLTFVLPAGAGLGWLVTGAGVPGFAVAGVIGVIGGSLGAALSAGRLRLETFTSRDDMVRHVVGGALMGVGGVLAGGDTIGLGVTGVSALGLAALLGLGGIVAGAVWALRWLETGRLWPLRAGSASPSPS